jgi:microcompartment protein CcmL/EutN
LSERDPALALFEFDSISIGIITGDAMVKAAPLGAIYAGTAHPGKYLVLVGGDTASVEVAVDVGREIGGSGVTDLVFLADAHPSVVAALSGESRATSLGDEALGIVETTTVASILDASDAGAKASAASIASIRLADGLGGKGYALFTGAVAEVEAAVDAAASRAEEHHTLIRSDVIAQLHIEMAHNLGRELRFLSRVSDLPGRR